MTEATRPPENIPCDGWTMSQERAHMENLVCSRFNFLLVFVGLALTAAVTTQNPRLMITTLWLGFVVAVCLMLTVMRAHLRFDAALDALHKLTAHPAAQTREMVGKCWYIPSVRGLVGYVIPGFLCFSLLVGAILASAGVFSANGGLEAKVGKTCTIQFRRGDALGGGGSTPVPPTTDNMNGAQVSMSGTLAAVEGDSILVKLPGQSTEIWIPRASILLIKFSP